MLKHLLVGSLFVLLVGCSTPEEGDGVYDVRSKESSMGDNYSPEPITSDLLEGKSVTEEKGYASRGEPAQVGDVIIYTNSDEADIGVSVTEVMRGEEAQDIAEEEGVTWDPEEGKELLLVQFKTYAFDTGDATVEDYGPSIMEVNPEKQGRSPGYVLTEGEETLETGESQEHQVIYEIDGETEDVHGVMDTAVNGELWFDLS